MPKFFLFLCFMFLAPGFNHAPTPVAAAPVTSSTDLMINQGAASTDSPVVRLSLACDDGQDIRLRNDGAAWTNWQTCQPVVAWMLAAGPAGPRTVDVQWRTAAQQRTASATIDLTVAFDPAPVAAPEPVVTASTVTANHTLYLPFTAANGANMPAVSDTCGMNAAEQAFADLMMSDPRQERPVLTCSEVLGQVARTHAEDMARRGYFDHTNPEGYGPNYLVRRAGYSLPSFYSTALDGNNIESIGAGYVNAAHAWEGMTQSHYHKMHLLGLQSFWLEQKVFGIGYAYNPDSPAQHYWVIITAPVQ